MRSQHKAFDLLARQLRKGQWSEYPTEMKSPTAEINDSGFAVQRERADAGRWLTWLCLAVLVGLAAWHVFQCRNHCEDVGCADDWPTRGWQ